MKNPSHGIPVGEFAALLVDAIDATGMRGRVLLQSFDAEALRSMRRIAPDIPPRGDREEPRIVPRDGGGHNGVGSTPAP